MLPGNWAASLLRKLAVAVNEKYSLLNHTDKPENGTYVEKCMSLAQDYYCMDKPVWTAKPATMFHCMG